MNCKPFHTPLSVSGHTLHGVIQDVNKAHLFFILHFISIYKCIKHSFSKPPRWVLKYQPLRPLTSSNLTSTMTTQKSSWNGKPSKLERLERGDWLRQNVNRKWLKLRAKHEESRWEKNIHTLFKEYINMHLLYFQHIIDESLKYKHLTNTFMFVFVVSCSFHKVSDFVLSIFSLVGPRWYILLYHYYRIGYCND